MQDQAAGFAYGWKKINNLDGINGIQWHSWFDHLGDGACLGLRKYADAPHNGEAKPVWTTYQKADTDEEDDYFEQYLSRIGIDSWEGIISRYSISDIRKEEAHLCFLFGCCDYI